MIPVALFAYRRPDLLELTLAALESEQIPLLIAFSDGPRGSADREPVAAVRRLLRSVSWCPVQLVERPGNLGLGRSVLIGVSSVLDRHEAVIVLEDDLICVQGAYGYLAAALSHYWDDRRVMSVTGWTHPRVTPGALAGQPYFDGKGECWLWGTWRRAWRGMGRSALDIMQDCAARGLDIERFGSDMPKMAAEADSRNLWAVGWWYHHLLNDGLCLRPPYSLCEHTGWDERGTTTVAAAAAWRNPPLRSCPALPARWPTSAEHPDCARLWRVAVGDPV